MTTDSPPWLFELADLQAEVERLKDVAARALEREMRADDDADGLAEWLQLAATDLSPYHPFRIHIRGALDVHNRRKAEDA